jgi:hypothetical protein
MAHAEGFQQVLVETASIADILQDNEASVVNVGGPMGL